MINIYVHAINDNVMIILRDLHTCKNKDVKIWVSADVAKDREFLRLSIKDAKNITGVVRNNNIQYFLWDVSTAVVSIADESQKNLYDRATKYKEEYVVIDTKRHPKDRLTMFSDAIQEMLLPEKFTIFRCFYDSPSLFDYLEGKNVFAFSLKDTSKFVLDAGLTHQEGFDVYKEIATGYYWYLDMLHKTHYEVFNKNHKHIGEASLSGKLDSTKKKDGRKL